MGEKSLHEWIADFTRDKKEVPADGDYNRFNIHSIRRYVCEKEPAVWEIALTYTGRLLIRKGEQTGAGVIVWEAWKTEHEIEIKD